MSELLPLHLIFQMHGAFFLRLNFFQELHPFSWRFVLQELSICISLAVPVWHQFHFAARVFTRLRPWQHLQIVIHYVLKVLYLIVELAQPCVEIFLFLLLETGQCSGAEETHD